MLEEFGDIYAVCRFGDDLGFRSSTLISARDIKEMVIPQYKRIVELVQSYGKPFLLHSCGCIFNVMDYSKGHGGIAIGSGNSIPDYVQPKGILQ